MLPRTFLVTGATGLLGSHLTRRLLAAGHTVVIAKRSTSDLWRIADAMPRLTAVDLDRSPLKALFEHPIDVILHCATDYGRKQVPALQVIEANLLLPLQLLELAEKAKIKTFINTDTILDKRVDYYSMSKRHFADWLQMSSTRLTCVNVALEHFYGPGDDRTKFVSRMVEDVVAGVPKIDLSPGGQKRDFIYIDDVVDAFLLLIDHSAGLAKGFYRFEVGSGRNISIQDFMQLLAKLAANATTRLAFGAVPYRENEVMESRVDSAALKALGWQPKVELSEGLRRTIEATRAKVARA